ncbi:MAG: radical SAM protein [Bacteroidales bacterium]|nr:radical SAM protein [Bacteroidales bacterium]
MACLLFDKIVFGPLKSRRLGKSLGVNLLPSNKKICTFNCVYCECGWTHPNASSLQAHYKFEDVISALEFRLHELSVNKEEIDSITFAGNGEPTLHPDFEAIVNKICVLRKKYFPEAKISVLSNASTLDKPSVVRALKRTDNPILKLDTCSEEIFELINKPLVNISISQIMKNIIASDISHVVIQTMFLRGSYNQISIDNTTEKEVALWLNMLLLIQPRSVMIYSLDRETPAHGLKKVSLEELELIAKKVRAIGIDAKAY